jgi:hypothetical protein
VPLEDPKARTTSPFTVCVRSAKSSRVPTNRFTASPHHGDRGWLAMRLDAPDEAHWSEIAELLESAYRHVTPRGLREHH